MRRFHLIDGRQRKRVFGSNDKTKRASQLQARSNKENFMDASLKLKEGMTFSGEADSGFSVQLSTTAAGGDGQGLKPMELILLGLGGCTGMDVISILRTMRQEVSGLEVKLHADQAAERPYVFTHITLEYIVRGRNVKPERVERAIQLSREVYCPAHAMLSKAATIDHTYEIVAEA
jgi:putative redox protein